MESDDRPDAYLAQFRAHLWAGERLRTAAAMAMLLALAAILAIRDLLTPPYNWRWLSITMGVILAVVAMEFVFYLLLRRSRRKRGEPSGVLLVIGVVAEANFPTFGLVLATVSPLMGPFISLVAPATLLYFTFIILSSLRMRPVLSFISGIAAAVGYMAVVMATYLLYGDRRAESPFELPVYFSNAIILLIAGALAALVSRLVLRNMTVAVNASLQRRKLEQDMAVARSIQQGLLPAAPPDHAGFDVAGSSQPADQTGGDYFDWVATPRKNTLLALADVTGHGIGPALLAANFHAYVRSLSSLDVPLADGIVQLNRYMASDLGEGRFITAATVLLHADGSGADILSAGHGPILLYRAATGRIETIEAQGPPLGIMADLPRREPHHVRMKTGDALVLVTDGLFEQVNEAGEQFGIARMTDSVARHAHRSAPGIIDGLYDDLKAFAGAAPQADDLTLLVARCTDHAAR